MTGSQYEQIIKYATALRLGTASAESILKRFTRDTKHPTYQALCKLGKAIKTITVSLITYVHRYKTFSNDNAHLPPYHFFLIILISYKIKNCIKRDILGCYNELI